jgi:outer membrane lipoprotein SlyB
VIARATVATLALAGCAQMPAPQSVATCSADAASALIGQPFTDARAADAVTSIGARQFRRIAPGTIVTMDYRVDRLNIDTDDQGVITRLHCG